MPRTTFHLRVWTRYFASVEQVWAFKTDPRRLAEEFRPYLIFLLRDTDALRRAWHGEPGEVRARLLPLGVCWPLRVEEVDAPHRFRDTSQNRLYARFEHEHIFEPTPDGCRYIDVVTFTPTLPLQKLTAILTRRLFVHRHRVAARHLPADARTVGTSVLRVSLVDEPEPDEPVVFGGP